MSVYKAKNGKTYTADFYINTGKRIRKAGFKTKSEAEAYERKMLTMRDSGTLINLQAGNTSLEDFYLKWIAITAKVSSLKTVQNYKEAWKSWVAPKFGNMPVKQINSLIIREWISNIPLKNGGIASNETAKRARTVLSQSLDLAVESGAIGFNPVRNLASSNQRYLPKPKQKEDVLLTFEQVLEAAHRSGHYRVFILFLALSGMRQSEAIALRVSDLNFQSREIRINKAFQTISGKLHLGPTKSNKARTSPMSSVIFNDLLAITSKLKSNDLVFTTPQGTPIDMNNFRKNVWRPIMKSMGIQNITPHALRMSFTTEAADMGMPIHQVSQLDGHSNSRVTIERYLKRNPQAVRESYAIVDAAFFKRALKYSSEEAADLQD